MPNYAWQLRGQCNSY